MTTDPNRSKTQAQKVGQIVEHPTKPNWGPGKILAISGSTVTVYFRDAQSGDPVKKLSLGYVNLRLAPEQSDPQLDNLPRYTSKTAHLLSKRLGTAQRIKLFQKHYPLGFEDPGSIGDARSGERSCKWRAHQLYLETLGGGQAEALSADGRTDELQTRFLALESEVNLLSPYEKTAFRGAIENPDAASQFFLSLVKVLDEPGTAEKRWWRDLDTWPAFDQLVSAVESLPAVGKSSPVKWTVLTLFPYLAQPDRHMFLKPEPTKKCAKRMAFKLLYTPRLNWSTYRQLLEMSHCLLDELKPLGAKDLIDVQSFIWLLGAKGDLAT